MARKHYSTAGVAPAKPRREHRPWKRGIESLLTQRREYDLFQIGS